MRMNIAIPVTLGAVFLLAALSTGSPVLLFLSVLPGLALIYGLASVLWAAGTLRLRSRLDTVRVQRGEDAVCQIFLRHRGFLPIAPIRLEVQPGTGLPAQEIFLRDRPGTEQRLTVPIRGAHVGLCRPGVQAWEVSDLLGLFTVHREVTETDTLLVLPRLFDTDPLTLAPGDPGTEMLARASEDLSSPSDIRSYQPGDAMKTVHWKLSLRKRELLVRKFDEPIQQEVLILMDCSRPPSWGHPEAEADLRDGLLETAASVFADQTRRDLTVHLPLFGAHPMELEKSTGLPLALENLALVDFSESDRFERVLVLESRRLRKIGCLVVVSARMNSAIVDTLIRMRNLGPAVRVYLVTFVPEDPGLQPLTGRLMQSGIQVEFVEPG